MNQVLRKVQLNSLTRHISSTSKVHSAYQGEGKTTLHILNNEADSGLMINGFSQVGFRLNNDITILGPMAIFPRSVLSWNIGSMHDINEKTLSLFSVLSPKLDVLVLGVGDKMEDVSLHTRLLPYIKKYRINIELLPTEQACSTFNFLNSEGRYVAGAFIPPSTITTGDEDVMTTKLRYQRLYEIDYEKTLE